MIEELLQEQARIANAAPIAFFYCSRDPGDPERADPENIIRSLLKQVATKTARDSIAGAVLKAYEKQQSEEKTLFPEPFTLEESKTVLLQILETNPVTLVLDGLDECNPSTRHNLLLAINEIIRCSASLVRVFISSRNDGDLVCQLEGCPNIYIKVTDNATDITNYVKHEVSSAIQNKRLIRGKVSAQTRQLLIQTLITGAQGMWVLSA